MLLAKYFELAHKIIAQHESINSEAMVQSAFMSKMEVLAGLFACSNTQQQCKFFV